MDALASLKAVTKLYAGFDPPVTALRNVTLDIGTGEFVAVMGASGSGKSTLLNLLGCLDRPTSGRVLIGNHDVSGLSAEARADLRNQTLGFVFQAFNLVPRTTALENVEMPMQCRRQERLSAQGIRRKARECLARVGLTDREEHFPNQLSGGQQQRVAIARALANNPTLLLADEPTGNLDSVTALEIMHVFQELNDTGIAIVMITHELELARYAKRMIVLRDGRVMRDEGGMTSRSATADLNVARTQLAAELKSG